MTMLSTRRTIIILTLFTILTHLLAGVLTSDTLLLLNSVGYLVLLWLLLNPPSMLAGQKSLVRWGFIGYTVLTIILYFVFLGADAFTQPIGILTKIDEVLLTIGLFGYKS